MNAVGGHRLHGSKDVARFRPQLPGVASAFEFSLRFVFWAIQLHTDPTAEQIAARFNVSRATSYRWRSAWLAARGTTFKTNSH